jgi:hypothetical protein
MVRSPVEFLFLALAMVYTVMLDQLVRVSENALLSLVQKQECPTECHRMLRLPRWI